MDQSCGCQPLLLGDLPQEKETTSRTRRARRLRLTRIIADYNARFGTNHRIGEFNLYYQDVQKRIKDQQYPNADLPHAEKIDITIVVDMLLTGFDSKYLNTLYVDKNVKHHGLIQAFSRTNRVLNDSKPYGNILDFRQQQKPVEDAITLFSGEKIDNPREIWLVDPAPKVIDSLQTATQKLADFMQSQGLANAPEDVANLKGDAARSQFVNLFKEVQRLKTQLGQADKEARGRVERELAVTVAVQVVVPVEQVFGEGVEVERVAGIALLADVFECHR